MREVELFLSFRQDTEAIFQRLFKPERRRRVQDVREARFHGSGRACGAGRWARWASRALVRSVWDSPKKEARDDHIRWVGVNPSHSLRTCKLVVVGLKVELTISTGSSEFAVSGGWGC